VIKLALMVVDECEIDGLWITNDMGTQTASYFSPKTYRELFKENDRKIVNSLHARGKKVMFHSHGNVMSLFEDFVDAGFDSIDPIDSYDGMDFKVVKEKYGRQVTLKGGISCTIGHMKKEELWQHIREVVAIGGSERFILSGAGGVPPEMSLENFNAYREYIYRVRRGDVK